MRRSRELREAVGHVFDLRAAGRSAEARKYARELRRRYKKREIEHEIMLQTNAARRLQAA